MHLYLMSEKCPYFITSEITILVALGMVRGPSHSPWPSFFLSRYPHPHVKKVKRGNLENTFPVFQPPGPG